MLPLAARSGPIQAADVQRERQTIPHEIALEKAQALDSLSISANRDVLRKLAAGISSIEQKLEQQDVSSQPTRSDLMANNLREKRINSPVQVTARTYFTCRPTNGLPIFLDRRGRSNPQPFLTAAELEADVNVLVPVRQMEVPACLSDLEIEQYLEIRIGQKLRLGDYWRNLHREQFDDSQLALMRYYDYLDLHAARHTVLVYSCTELRSGEH